MVDSNGVLYAEERVMLRLWQRKLFHFLPSTSLQGQGSGVSAPTAAGKYLIKGSVPRQAEGRQLNHRVTEVTEEI
jgi:hypothetical protein